MKNSFKLAALCSVLLLAPAVSGQAHDDHNDGFVVVDDDTDMTNPNINFFNYEYYAGPEYYPYYNLVRTEMAPVYKNTFADTGNPDGSNPMIGVTEFDLNNDNVAEIISFPIEEEERGDIFCGKSYLCPHFVIDTGEKKPKVIGVIKAFAVDRGDDIKNGHWTLKAFTKQLDPENFGYYDTYSFDKKTGSYQIDKTPTPLKSTSP